MAQPILYEINTRCWLRQLSERAGHTLSLAEVPDATFKSWPQNGFTHIWLMGVWTGGPLARGQALNSPGLARAYSEALPGWTEKDVAASPYAIAQYQVSADLGGDQALDGFRAKLQSHGLKLLLDFVPNHLGLDHPWVKEHPDLFVQSSPMDSDSFATDTVLGKRFLAHGKDPNCPSWTDTVQLEYRKAETRSAMKDILTRIADRCDGVRCDMAMLVLNGVFANTWKNHPQSESTPASEFWSEAIGEIRKNHPGFIFLAEVYWGLETRLQSLGFDFTYDKTLYDNLVSRSSHSAQRHLLGTSPACLAASAHFLENHDEPRIASILSESEQRAAALVILGLPGMRFLHDGQLSGARRRLPVQLLRRAQEAPDPMIAAMYDRLLGTLRQTAIGRGHPELLVPGQAWAGNPTADHFVLVQWTESDVAFDLVAVNLAPHPSQCFAPLKLPASAPVTWRLRDRLGDQEFLRETADLKQRGLFLDLPAHGAQVFQFEPHT